MGELPFKGRLLVSDMDGTLLNSSHRISKENRKALQRFVEGGGYFTVATGRTEKSVMNYIEDLPINVPAIVYNGAVIYDFKTGRILWEDHLAPEVIRPIQEVIKRYPGIGVEIFHEDKIIFSRDNQITLEHQIREKLMPIHMEPEEVPQPWRKAILAWDPDKLPEVEEFLKSFTEPFTMVYSERYFLELLNRNTSKGTALKKLTELMGLEDACVLAMGDNPNDLEMIRLADVGIAVDNAHNALKDAADVLCAHHDEHAVSEVIDWIEAGKIGCG